MVACKHPESDVEPIAQQEYPGGAVLWCSICGAWRDEDKFEWHTTKYSTAFTYQVPCDGDANKNNDAFPIDSCTKELPFKVTHKDKEVTQLSEIVLRGVQADFVEKVLELQHEQIVHARGGGITKAEQLGKELAETIMQPGKKTVVCPIKKVNDDIVIQNIPHTFTGTDQQLNDLNKVDLPGIFFSCGDTILWLDGTTMLDIDVHQSNISGSLHGWFPEQFINKLNLQHEPPMLFDLVLTFANGATVVLKMAVCTSYKINFEASLATIHFVVESMETSFHE